MKEIKDFPLKKMSCKELAERFSNMGVFGAGRVSEAVEIINSMITDKGEFVWLCIAGPLAPAGMGRLFAEMIEKGYVNGVISSSANLTHDIAHAIGGKHFNTKDDKSKSDFKNIEEDESAAGDMIIPNATFMKLEEAMKKWMNEIINDKKSIKVSELMNEIGKKVHEEKEKEVYSFVEQCYLKEVPIFCPGFADSMLGVHSWLATQNKDFVIDTVKDYSEMIRIFGGAKKNGAIMLGGGLPKNYVSAVALMDRGMDDCVQITTDHPESGSASGASLEEAKTWKKIKEDGRIVDVIGDATILFPLIMSAVEEGMNK